jgi:hypothetical protein
MTTLCNFTTAINGSDNIGLSRLTINTNFSNLDTAACTLSTAVLNLSSQISSGALQGQPGDPGSSFFAPVGTIALFSGNTPGNGWLLCDGTQYQTNSGYQNLQAVIGYTYNITGDSNDPAYVRVPNLLGKLAVGASTQLPLGTKNVITIPAGNGTVFNYLSLKYYIKAF